MVGVELKILTFFPKRTKILSNLSHVMNCKKNLSPKNFFYFLICCCLVNLHSIFEKKMGVFRATFFATEL